MEHGKLIEGRDIKCYHDIKIKMIENAFVICYDVEYMPMEGMGKGHFEHYEADRSWGVKEAFEFESKEKKDSACDRALSRIKELVMYSH